MGAAAATLAPFLARLVGVALGSLALRFTPLFFFGLGSGVASSSAGVSASVSFLALAVRFLGVGFALAVVVSFPGLCLQREFRWCRSDLPFSADASGTLEPPLSYKSFDNESLTVKV